MKPFLFALLASVGMNALANETPDLKFGVISDIHLREHDDSLKMVPEKAGLAGTCLFGCADLPLAGHYVFSVRPIECFGKKGAAIVSEMFELRGEEK